MNVPYSQKSDIWSLGVVLYELCSLRHPFDANSMESLLKKIVKVQHAPLSSKLYSPELRSLIDAMLQKDPRKRPSINEIVRMGWLQERIQRFLTPDQIEAEFSHTMLHGYIPAPVPTSNEGEKFGGGQKQQQQGGRKKKRQPSIGGQGQVSQRGVPPLSAASASSAAPPSGGAAVPALPPSSRGLKPVKRRGPSIDSHYLPSPRGVLRHVGLEEESGLPPPVLSGRRRRANGRAAAAGVEGQQAREAFKRMTSEQEQQYQQHYQQQPHPPQQQYMRGVPQLPPVGGAGPYTSSNNRQVDDVAYQKYREYEHALLLQREREQELDRERLKEAELQRQMGALKGRAPAAASYPIRRPSALHRPQHTSDGYPPAGGLSEGRYRRPRPSGAAGGEGVDGPHLSSGPLPPPTHPRHLLHEPSSSAQQQRLPPTGVPPHQHHHQSPGHSSKAERREREEEELARIRDEYESEKKARRHARLEQQQQTRNHILPVGQESLPPPNVPTPQRAAPVAPYAQSNTPTKPAHPPPTHAAYASPYRHSPSLPPPQIPSSYSAYSSATGGGGGVHSQRPSISLAASDDEYANTFVEESPRGRPPPSHSRLPSVSPARAPRYNLPPGSQGQAQGSPSSWHPAPPPRRDASPSASPLQRPSAQSPAYNIPPPSYLGSPARPSGGAVRGIPATTKLNRKPSHLASPRAAAGRR